MIKRFMISVSLLAISALSVFFLLNLPALREGRLPTIESAQAAEKIRSNNELEATEAARERNKEEPVETVVVPKTVEKQIETKQEAVERMINTVDYYNSIETIFIHSNYLTGVQKTIHLSAITMPEDIRTCIETASDQQEKTMTVYGQGKIEEKPYDQNWPGNNQEVSRNTIHAGDRSQTLAETFHIAEDGVSVAKFRQEAHLFRSAQVVAMPVTYVCSFLYDETTYELTGKEKIAGREAVIVEGAIPIREQSNYVADQFRIGLDAKTGVLLSLKLIDSGTGKETASIEVQSIQYDHVPAIFNV